MSDSASTRMCLTSDNSSHTTAREPSKTHASAGVARPEEAAPRLQKIKPFRQHPWPSRTQSCPHLSALAPVIPPAWPNAWLCSPWPWSLNVGCPLPKGSHHPLGQQNTALSKHSHRRHQNRPWPNSRACLWIPKNLQTPLTAQTVHCAALSAGVPHSPAGDLSSSAWKTSRDGARALSSGSAQGSRSVRRLPSG